MTNKLTLPCELWVSPEEVAAKPLAERTTQEQQALCAYNSGTIHWEEEHTIFGSSYRLFTATPGYSPQRNSFVNERGKALR